MVPFVLNAAVLLASPTCRRNAPSGVVDSLVGAWTYDQAELAVDASGNANHGQLFGVSLASIGRSLDFRGTSGFKEVPASPSLDLTDAFTLAAWVNLAEVGTGRQVLLQKVPVGADDTHTNYTFYVQWTHDALALVTDSFKGVVDASYNFGLRIDAQGKPLNLYLRTVEEGWRGGGSRTFPFEVGVWYHVAATYDGIMRVLYVNGKEIGRDQATAAPDVIRPITEVEISAVGRGWPFPGSIAEVRIYSRPLTAAEITQLYQRVLPGSG